MRLAGFATDFRTSGLPDFVMIVTSSAPIRICDCGGWTDTWFASHGRVLNIAVRPRAHVTLQLFPAAEDRPPVIIEARDFRERYVPLLDGSWGPHPLLEATIEQTRVPDHLAIEVAIACDVPPGASTGTSAAVVVALIGALDRARGGSMTSAEIAKAAHAVETERLGQQSGLQDQICAAMGGVNDIEITDYPHVEVRQLVVPHAARGGLQDRLSLVYLGRGHVSSAIHERVIEHVRGRGPDCPELQDLRRAASHAAHAVTAGDLQALGVAMLENTEAQRRLHPELVCADADRVIHTARKYGAIGWKVNGAGGDGGSLTLLGPDDVDANRAMISAIVAACPSARHIPTVLDNDGVRVDVTP